jgi:hypothetical protein
VRIIKGRMTQVHWLGLATAAVALAGAWAWHRSPPRDCEPAVQLVVLARGKQPWLWDTAPAHYLFRVTGPDLNAAAQFDKPFGGAVGSPRLSVRQHEKGVVAFQIRSPPPRFKVALELDGATVFERELTFQSAGPCYRQSINLELPPSVADLVDRTNRESEAGRR